MSWYCRASADTFVPEFKTKNYEEFINWGTTQVSTKN